MKRVLPHMRRSEQKVRKYIDAAVSPKAPRQEAVRAKGPKQTEVQKWRSMMATSGDKWRKVLIEKLRF